MHYLHLHAHKVILLLVDTFTCNDLPVEFYIVISQRFFQWFCLKLFGATIKFRRDLFTEMCWKWNCKSRFLKILQGSWALKMVWTQKLLNGDVVRAMIAVCAPFPLSLSQGATTTRGRSLRRCWRTTVSPGNRITLDKRPENIKLQCVSTLQVPRGPCLKSLSNAPPTQTWFRGRPLSPLLIALPLLLSPHQERGVPALRQGARPRH